MASAEHEDDVTVPVPTRSRLRAEYEELELAAGERGEIVFSPDALMCRPVLSVQVRGSGQAVVEDIYAGKRALARHGRWPAECLRDGLQMEISVSKELPLKIVMFNVGPGTIVAGASLVTGARKEKS